MKTTKRFLSAIMASAFVFSSIITVSAAGSTNTGAGEVTNPTDAEHEPSETKGDGSLEGYADKEIFRVVIPTNSLNFIVDPQGLIKGSYKDDGTVANTKYKAATTAWNFKNNDDTDRDDGFVFFSHQIQVESGTSTVTKTEYTNHLDLVVENKGSIDITVTPTISYADGTITLKNSTTSDPMGLTQKSGFSFAESDKNTYVSFKLFKGSEAASGPETLTNVDGCYKVTFASNAYKYELDNDAYATRETDSNTITYTLSAISNPYAENWTTVLDNVNGKAASGTTKVAPELKVLWDLKKVTE